MKSKDNEKKMNDGGNSGKCADKFLRCADCNAEFLFTAGEQEFYATKGFTEPKRCPSCRKSRKANFRNRDWE